MNPLVRKAYRNGYADDMRQEAILAYLENRNPFTAQSRLAYKIYTRSCKPTFDSQRVADYDSQFDALTEEYLQLGGAAFTNKYWYEGCGMSYQTFRTYASRVLGLGCKPRYKGKKL